MNIARFFLISTGYAHCDIPCGVYDPTPAQIAAHTVLRMTGLLEEKTAASAGSAGKPGDMHDVA